MTYTSLYLYFNSSDCESFGPLGITDGSIKESQLSVSSVFQMLSYRVGHEPYGAGLHSDEYWAPAAGVSSHDRRQYVQVDFRSLKDIKMVRRTWKMIK